MQDLSQWSRMVDMQPQQAARLSATLRSLRKRQRISQSTLASLSRVSRTTITNIEAGTDPMTDQPPSPRADTLRALARGLATDGHGVRHDELETVFYAELMDAAGYLPTAWNMADALRSHIPEAAIPGFVAECAGDPIEAQQARARGIIRSANTRRRKNTRRHRTA